MPRFDLPADRMVPLDHVELRLTDEPLPFAVDNHEAIARHWEVAKAAQPALFDGKVVLFSEMRLKDRRLEGRCHMVGYSALLYWRSLRPHPEVVHCFAHPALVGSDGALVAIRMARHTANPGKVYFAAGSLEPPDFRDGVADMPGNMAREVCEETGLDLSLYRHEPTYHALSTVAGTVIFRRFQLDIEADEAARRIAAHVADDPDPEIEGAVIIRDSHASPEGLLPHMAVFRDWHFATPMRL